MAFNFLKKKEKEPAGVKPANQSPEEMKEELLGKKDSVPETGDIPLPPPKTEDVPLSDPRKEISMPEPAEEIPLPPPKEEEIENKPLEVSTKQNIPEPEHRQETNTVEETPEEDFSLPDFTEEELNILDEPLPEPTKEVPEDIEMPSEISKTTYSEAPTEQEQSIQSNIPTIPKAEEFTPPVKPILTETKKNSYLKVENCNMVYNFTDLSQTTLKDLHSEIQKHQNKNKKTLQTYKEFHDNLDVIQEKLMEMDGVLFGR